MTYSVRTTRRADADVDRHVAWIMRHISRAAAVRWQNRLTRAIQSLTSLPGRCPQADEAVDLGIDLRELISGRRRNVYRILFTIDGNTVIVLSVRHAAQDRLTPDDI